MAELVSNMSSDKLVGPALPPMFRESHDDYEDDNESKDGSHFGRNYSLHQDVIKCCSSVVIKRQRDSLVICLIGSRWARVTSRL